jgi:hypothetical protein
MAVESLRDLAEGRPHDVFERSGGRVGTAVLVKERDPSMGSLLLPLAGIGRQQIVYGAETLIIPSARLRLHQWPDREQTR